VKAPTFAPFKALTTQPLFPFAEAQPVTVTFATSPFDLKVTVARVASSASETQALAPPRTVPIAAWTAPCDGCSGSVLLRVSPPANSGSPSPPWTCRRCRSPSASLR